MGIIKTLVNLVEILADANEQLKATNQQLDHSKSMKKTFIAPMPVAYKGSEFGPGVKSISRDNYCHIQSDIKSSLNSGDGASSCRARGWRGFARPTTHLNSVCPAISKGYVFLELLWHWTHGTNAFALLGVTVWAGEGFSGGV